MDYEKMYNELKEKYDNMETTFNTYKETTDKEKSELQTQFDTYKTDSEKEIADLKQANISLFLKVPKEPQPNTEPTPQEKKSTCDDIVNHLLGGK